jgi:hypothetical protein
MHGVLTDSHCKEIGKMKRCLMMLALLGAAHLAPAQAAEPAAAAPAPAKAGTAEVPGEAGSAKAPSRHRNVRHRAKAMPRGDMRQCLDLKTNKAIIRCAETRKRR